MKKTATLLFLFLTLLFSAQLSSGEKVLQEADFHYNRNEYAQAIPYYKTYFKANQKDYEAFDRLGICYYRTGDFENAKQNFRRAALLCPVREKAKLATYYSNLSASYSNLQEYEKAYQYAAKAYGLDATPHTLFNAASMANNLERCTEGLKLLDLTKLPKDNSYNALYALCHYKQGNYETSIQYYETFFLNFNAVSNTVDFNMAEEKINLFKSYLSSAADASSTLNESRKEKISSLYLEIIKDEAAEMKLFDLLKDPSRSWSKSKRAVDLINSLVEKEPQAAVQKKIRLMFAQKNLKEMHRVADDYLKQNTVTDEKLLFALKASRYYGYLYTLTDDQPKSTLEIPQAEILKLKGFFEDIYPKKRYADAELTKEILNPLEGTLEVFRKIAKTEADQKRLAPMVQKIVGNFPNEKIAAQINAVLAGGRLSD